jgi:hypothetical protein
LKVIDKINPAVRQNESAATRPLKRQIGVEDVGHLVTNAATLKPGSPLQRVRTTLETGKTAGSSVSIQILLNPL